MGENEITFAIWLLCFCCVNKSCTVSGALSKDVINVPGKVKTKKQTKPPNKQANKQKPNPKFTAAVR